MNGSGDDKKYLAVVRYQYKINRFAHITGMLTTLAPSTYTFAIAAALWYDDQYGMATVVAVSLVLAWAIARRPPSDLGYVDDAHHTEQPPEGDSDTR